MSVIIFKCRIHTVLWYKWRSITKQVAAFIRRAGGFLEAATYRLTTWLPQCWPHPFMSRVTIIANNYWGIPLRFRNAVAIAVGHNKCYYAQLEQIMNSQITWRKFEKCMGPTELIKRYGTKLDPLYCGIYSNNPNYATWNHVKPKPYQNIYIRATGSNMWMVRPSFACVARKCEPHTCSM